MKCSCESCATLLRSKGHTNHVMLIGRLVRPVETNATSTAKGKKLRAETVLAHRWNGTSRPLYVQVIGYESIAEDLEGFQKDDRVEIHGFLYPQTVNFSCGQKHAMVKVVVQTIEKMHPNRQGGRRGKKEVDLT